MIVIFVKTFWRDYNGKMSTEDEMRIRCLRAFE